MNLSFNILWVEDDIDFFDECKDTICDFLLEQQLKPIVDYKASLSEEDIKKIGNKYDLILVDYNLSNAQGSKFGTEIISAIRKKSLLPDIIFYSSLNTIDDIVKQEKKDNRTDLVSILQNGIYYTSAELNSFYDTVQKVIQKILSREQKINGFKGMVLSSVSEFERIVNDILKLSLSKMDGSQKEIFKNYILSHILEEHADDIKDILENFRNGDCNKSLDSLLDADNRYLDHNKRTRIMKKATKILFKYDFDLDRYQEITDLRNALGHLPIEINENEPNQVIILPKGVTKQFNSALIKETRMSIKMWDREFESILKKFD